MKAIRKKMAARRAAWLGGLLVAIILASAVAGAQTSASRAQALENEAQAAMRGGQFVEAISRYQEALAIAPRGASAEIGLASAYRAVHNYDEAKNLLERTAREHPGNEEALAALGDLEIEMQTYGAAVRHLAAAVALKPGDTASRIRLAVAYKESGDTKGAIAQLAKVLQSEPRSALAYYERAQIYSDQNEDAAALRDAEKAVEIDANAPGRLLLATILLRPPHGAAQADAARCSRAAKTLEPLMPEHANDSETLFLLSRAYQCAGQKESAQKTLDEFEAASKNDRATKENETEAKHLVQQANDAAMKNDLRGAIDLVQQALAKDPNYGAAYSQLAKLEYSAGEIEKASEAIGKALAQEPYQPDFLYVEGKILEKQGRWDEALAAFERTTLVNPKESDAYFEMGAIYERRNDRARAIEAYKKAVELSPDDPEYRKALAAVQR